MPFYCNVCKNSITQDEYKYSSYKYKIPLCRYHQANQAAKDTNISRELTTHELRLYNELRKLGIKCKLNDTGGFKTTDISIPRARIDIRVDEKIHSNPEKQKISDLRRSELSDNDGVYTFKVSKAEIDEDVQKVAKAIAALQKTGAGILILASIQKNWTSMNN